MENFSEHQNNEHVFNNCTFGINFQIIPYSGIHKFTFKNCTFKNSSIPFILAKAADIEVYLTSCNFENTVVENQNSVVYIYYTSCIFKKNMWTGKECATFASGDEIITTSGLKSIKSSNSDYKEQRILYTEPIIRPKQAIFKAIKIDSDDYEDAQLKLKPETEFVYITGNKPVRIFLPDQNEVENAHYIQILNKSSYVRIDDKDYSDRVINIRYLSCGEWVFFNQY